MLLMVFESINIYLHLAEWWSILFIILTQKNRPVEKILSDHENENMQTSFMAGLRTSQLVYRKAEVCLLRIYKIIGLLVLAANLWWTILWFVGNVDSAFIASMFCVFNSIILLGTYLCLHHVMKKYHHFEYQRTWKTIFI